MKKLISIGLLTVCALAFSERSAQAWINAKFSVGLNWHLQSANNNFFWGMYKNGQVPGPEAFGGGAYPYNVPFGTNPPTGAFPFFGNAPQGYPHDTPTQTAPPPQTAQQQQAYYGALQNWSYNPYQTVSYQPSNYFYPNYYYPIYNPYYNPYYGYQVPSYWYQGR
jgi:hypothetical protein